MLRNQCTLCALSNRALTFDGLFFHYLRDGCGFPATRDVIPGMIAMVGRRIDGVELQRLDAIVDNVVSGFC